MSENIITIEHTYDMRPGLYEVRPIECESDAAYYAAGRRAYFYKSLIDFNMYLIVPVNEVKS